MLNKKRMLAMAMTSAMIVSALAGCSSEPSTNATTTAANVETTTTEASNQTEETTTAADDTSDDTKAPGYTVEAGKVLDFEDGNFGFVKTSAGSLLEDPADVSIVDFNGSKALKVAPTSNTAGKVVNVGLDITSLLGDKAADVASVKMQIGVSSADGSFNACAGNIYMSYSDMAAADGEWVVYMEDKNPMDVSAAFPEGESYDTSKKNVLLINKASNSGNNSDVSFKQTGEYSTMYIDNIVFFDKDGNALEVNSAATFDAPDDYGVMDWSNLIDVSANQVVFDGWSEGQTKGWDQGAWHQNKCVVTQNVQQTDEEGNLLFKQKVNAATGEPVTDENGDPVYTKTPLYVQATDEAGELLFDEEGNPIYVTEDVEQGEYDFGSIMKPGTVFTIYYSCEETEDLNHYIWFVFTSPDLSTKYSKLGWARLLAGPDAAAASGNPDINYNTPIEEQKGYLFMLNDSHTMAQVTYDEIVNYLVNFYGVDEADLNWEGLNFSLQCEAGMTWSVSAVTYATDAY
ncbi:MAG: hypothetical protein K6F92_07575 [Lachnospiraceae bacterium]|nr:hypothetical protein [Lachnospiraceae bacterium]